MDDLVAMIRLYIGVLILGCGAFGIKYFFERRRFAEIKSLQMIANLPWREFEFFVVQRLEKEWWIGMKVGKWVADGGADFSWYYKGVFYLGQCKCYAITSKVVEPDVRRLLGTINDMRLRSKSYPTRWIFVTTAGFTKPAKELAASNDIVLRGGHTLVRKLGIWKKEEIGEGLHGRSLKEDRGEERKKECCE